MKKFVGELDKEWFNKDGSLTLKGLMAWKIAVTNPIEHRTVDLSIKQFKRYLKQVPMMTKGIYSQQVKLYKKKAWTEYIDVINFKGSFPTYNGAADV